MEDLDQLNKDFGGILSVSVIRGIYDVNPQNARRTLDEINRGPTISDGAKTRMIEFYSSQFNTLSHEEIESCLKEVNYNEDAVVFALLELGEKKNRIATEIRWEKEREQDKIRVKKEAFDRIQTLFENVPKEEIQQLLDENDGNVNQTIDILLLKIREKEEKTKQQTLKTNLINELSKRLRTKEARAQKALEENNWEYEKACEQLSKVITNEKFSEFVKIFPDLEPQTILLCLGFDDDENMEKLNKKRIEKKADEEARKQREKEVEERRISQLAQIEAIEKERRERAHQDRINEERRRKEEEEKASAEERKRLEEIRRKEEELRIKAEEEKRIQEEERRKKEEKEEQERKRIAQIEEEAQAKRDQEELLKKIEEFALRKSVIVNSIMKAEIIKQNQKADEVDTQIRKDLDTFLRPEIGKQPGIVQKPIEKKPRGNDSILGAINIPEPEVKEQPHIKAEESKEVVNKTTPESKYVTLSLEHSVYDWGKYIILNWTHSVFATTSDWVGLYKKDEPTNTNYISYAYVTVSGEKKHGSMDFTAPKISGEYEFRYFTFGSYTLFGVSNSIKVGPQIKMISEVNQSTIKINLEEISTIVPNSFKTWIAMYTSDKSIHSDFYSYQWVTSNTPTIFVVPKCGKWFFRLFNNTSRYDYMTCCDAFVEGKDEIKLQQTSDNLIVSFDLKSVDLSYDSPWLGIYRKDEELMNMYEQYKYLSVAKGEFKMNKLRAGEWEARLFSTAHNGVISTSNIIIVAKQ